VCGRAERYCRRWHACTDSASACARVWLLTALCRLFTALCRLCIAQCRECGLLSSSGMLLCDVEVLSLHRAARRRCSVLFCHAVRDALILNLHCPSHAHAMSRITAAWILSLTLGFAVQEGGRRRGLPGAAALP